MAVGTTGVVENTKDNTYNIVRILSRTELPRLRGVPSDPGGWQDAGGRSRFCRQHPEGPRRWWRLQAIAKRYGQDSTTTWFTGAMYEQASTMSQDNRAYIEALLNGAVGSTQNIELTQGNVVIQVLNRKAMKSKAVAAVIKKEIRFSDNTYSKAYNRFSQFVTQSQGQPLPTCRSTPRSLATRSRISTTSPPPAIRWATSVVPASATPSSGSSRPRRDRFPSSSRLARRTTTCWCSA